MSKTIGPDSPKAAKPPTDDKRVKSTIDAVIPYPPIAVAAAGLFGVYVAHRLSMRREAIGQFHAAAVKFRAAFAPELLTAEADTGGSINYMDVLRTAHDERHAQAVIEFEPFIPKAKLSSFRSDWNRYRYGENKDGSPVQPGADGMDHEALYFLEYSIEWDLSRPERPRQNAIRRINALLDYARTA